MSTIISREQDLFPYLLVAIKVIDMKLKIELRGAPEMTPVVEFNERPDGNVPLTMEKVTKSPMTEGVREADSFLGRMHWSKG